MAAKRSANAEAIQIGQRIRERREALGMSVQALAVYASDSDPTGLQITKSWLSRVERGQIPSPSYVRLARIADRLSCTVQELGGPAAPGPTAHIEVPQDKVLPLRQRLAGLPEAAIEELNKIAEALGHFTHRIHADVLEPPAAQPDTAEQPEQHGDGKQPRNTPAEAACYD